MMKAKEDYTYHDELGPVVEIPIKLRIPKNLYDIWNEITSNHRGWASDLQNNRGFEYEVNWEILRLYMNYLEANDIVLHEAIGKMTTDNLLSKFQINVEYLQKVEKHRDCIDGILDTKGGKDITVGSAAED